MTRTSTVNLTLTIVSPGGVPAALTAAKIAQIAEQAVHPYLTRGTVVTGTVSSAFIVRTEPVIPTPDEVEPGAEWFPAPGEPR